MISRFWAWSHRRMVGREWMRAEASRIIREEGGEGNEDEGLARLV
jgi:hypothetical protein